MRVLLALAARNEAEAVFPDAGDWPEHTALPRRLAGREVLVCLTGVGPVNAALGMGRALAAQPDIGVVVLAGLAGSFDLAQAPLGSAWRVQREVWPEYGLVESAGVNARALGFPQWTGPQGVVWDSLALPDPESAPAVFGTEGVSGAKNASGIENASGTEGASGAENTPGAERVQGLRAGWAARAGLSCALPAATAITVAGVTGTRERAARLCSRHGALLENMEGFAVALACARQGVPLLEVRVVSNLVGSRAPEHRAFGAALTHLRSALERLLASGTCHA